MYLPVTKAFAACLATLLVLILLPGIPLAVRLKKKTDTMMSASDVARLHCNGKMTTIDLITDLLAKIRNSSDQSIFITVTEEQALSEARASDEPEHWARL